MMRTRCASCDSERLELVLDLGASVPACSMTPVGSPAEAYRQAYPLQLLRCHDCTLVQLSCVVDRNSIFHSRYPYSSGNSSELRAHFSDLARGRLLGLREGDLIVDIGANDGTLLSKYSSVYRRVGVEPTDQIDKAQQHGIVAVKSFFGSEVSARIVAEHGQAKIVTACNVLAHVDDIHDVLSGVNELLAPDGVFVAENHDLGSVLAGQWDTVYHEHLYYFTPKSFASLLEAHGLLVFGLESISTHGGSFRVYASGSRSDHLQIPALGKDQPSYRFLDLAVNARRARSHLRSALGVIHAQPVDERVYGIGATARASTIIGYCGLTHHDVQAVLEVPCSDKLDHFMAGTRIAVISEEVLRDGHAPEHLLLFSWHLGASIIPKLRGGGSRELGYKGEIIVPLPDVRRFR